MTCPICRRRKAKRFCPARGENICSICCGTEREVTIDCPAHCPYLVASRQYDAERREIDWSKLPFAEVKIDPSFARGHEGLLAGITRAISAYARARPEVVDSDVIAALRALGEAYQTLAKGLYYEKPPEYALQRELYEGLKRALEDFKKLEAERIGLSSTRDSEIRDALIFFTQLGATRENGRAKGRAFLHLLRTQLSPEGPRGEASNILVVP